MYYINATSATCAQCMYVLHMIFIWYVYNMYLLHVYAYAEKIPMICMRICTSYANACTYHMYSI